MKMNEEDLENIWEEQGLGLWVERFGSEEWNIADIKMTTSLQQNRMPE